MYRSVISKGWRAGAVLVVGLCLMVPGAEAQTGWAGFGNAASYGRGSLGTPWAEVTSTTRRDPTSVRLVFDDGGRTKRSTLSWRIYCWNEDTFDTWDRGTNGVARSLPLTISWTPPVWVDFCEVRASAYHFDTGLLKIVAQARYPS